MMQNGPIQTLPRGLLGLLQLKNMGVAPAELGRQVYPCMDIEGYYLRNQSALLNPSPSFAIGAGAGAGAYNRFSTNPVIVPDNECWWVESFTLSFALGAAADRISRMQPMIFYNRVATNDFSFLANEGGYSVGATAAIANETCFVSARNFWLPPGAELGVGYGEKNIVGAGTIFGFVRKASLPI